MEVTVLKRLLAHPANEGDFDFGWTGSGGRPSWSSGRRWHWRWSCSLAVVVIPVGHARWRSWSFPLVVALVVVALIDVGRARCGRWSWTASR